MFAIVTIKVFSGSLPIHFRSSSGFDNQLNFLRTISVNEHETPLTNVEEEGYEDWPVNI